MSGSSSSAEPEQEAGDAAEATLGRADNAPSRSTDIAGGCQTRRTGPVVDGSVAHAPVWSLLIISPPPRSDGAVSQSGFVLP